MYADRYSNGVRTRLVHYLGKEWHDTRVVRHLVTDGNFSTEVKHYTSVKANRGQMWPKSFGPHLRSILMSGGI